MIRVRALALCACAIIAVGSPLKAVAQGAHVGIVVEVRGEVFWRPNARAKWKRLSREADVARLLYASEQIRCARGGALRLWLSGESETRWITGRFTIPRPAVSRTDPVRRMLDEQTRPSGIVRTGAVQVFSPSDHSAARPRPFPIRWARSAEGCSFSFLIQDVSGGPVWRRRDVEGSLGALDDTSAEEALSDYRAAHGSGPLMLVVDDSCVGTAAVNFSLLSADDERSLDAELAFWDKQTGTFVPHIGRASVFSRYRMFPQAAREYEAALKEAPRSLHLLTRAIAAEREVGNLSRVQELKKRLAAETTAP